MIYLSIIVPVYERYIELKRLLESLKSQTLKTFEVIIIDDGSTISYGDLLSEYDSILEINYYKIKNSGGPAKPRNFGISLAKYEWISFLDSDDWWDSNRVEVVVNEIKKNGAEFFYHKMRIVVSDHHNKWWKRKIIGGEMSSDTFRHLMIVDNPIPNSTVVVSKNCIRNIGGINETLQSAEDYECWVRLAKSNIKFHFINKTLGSYWMSKDGISSNLSLSTKCTVNVLEKYKEFLPKNLYRNLNSRIDYLYGSTEYSLGNRKNAKVYLLSARSLYTLELRIKRFLKIIMITIGIK